MEYESSIARLWRTTPRIVEFDIEFPSNWMLSEESLAQKSHRRRVYFPRGKKMLISASSAVLQWRPGIFSLFFFLYKMSGHGCVFEANVNGQHPKSHRWSIAVPSVSFLNTWRRTMKISRTHSIERVHNVVLCSCCCRKKKRRNCFWKNELFEEVQLSFWRAFVIIRRVSVDWLPHVPSSWNGNNSGACLPTPSWELESLNPDSCCPVSFLYRSQRAACTAHSRTLNKVSTFVLFLTYTINQFVENKEQTKQQCFGNRKSVDNNRKQLKRAS